MALNLTPKATAAKRENKYTPPSTDVNVLANKRILQYPIGLGSKAVDEYGKDEQYMMFKINTDEKTTSLRDDVKGGDVTIPLNNRLGTRIGKNILAKDGDPDLKFKFDEASINNTQFVQQKGMVRLDKVIILPMPNDHRVSTNLEYKEQLQTGLTKVGDMFNQGLGALGNDLGKYVKNKGLSALVNVIKSGGTNSDALLAEEGLLMNPKMEVMFKGFSFREFQFDYHFAPKSVQESEIVRDIIETFRYYALPEITAGKFFYIMPSEFEVSFMQGQKDNPNIPRITTSALKAINVNYSPGSVWATLPNGAPVAITMTLQFYELELVDRSRVYNPESNVTSGY